jgi:tRNA pseudouridine38-40 synthase
VRPLLLWIRYDGTDFHGWQIQAEGIRTVQGELKQALTTMLGEDFRLATSSRTDAGVHALRHPAVVRTGSNIAAGSLQRGLNALLPRDVAVADYRPVAPGFDSRRFSLGKTYCYRVNESFNPDPFRERYSWRPRARLNLSLMKEAARHLVGEHDFDSFRSIHCDSPTTRRLIQSMHVERQGQEVRIVVTGNAFLRNMVRVMAGTLVDVGRRRLTPGDIPAILESKDRNAASMTAPAQGLTLVDVYYPPEILCYGAHGW